MAELTWQAWATMGITVCVFTLALATKLKTYFIFMCATLALMVLGILEPKEAVAGFSSTSVVTAGILFVVVAGMERAGLMHWLVRHLLKTPKNIVRGVVGIMLPAAGLSSFLSNTSVVAILINVVRIWCRKMKISPSKLLIPLSYAAGTGGALTLIGSPSTLIIADLYQTESGESLGFFSPTIPALCCMMTCVVTILLLKRLLPDNKLLEEDEEKFSDMRTVMTVPPDSPLVARTIGEAGLNKFGGARLVELRHFDEEKFAPVPAEEPIMGGDRLVFEGGLTKIEEEDVVVGRRTLWAALILVGMVTLTLTGVFPLITACSIAAFAMIALRCCTIEEGYKGINWQVMIVWAGSIALGKALETTGVADAIATGLVSISGGHPLAILLVICFIGTFLTEFVSNTAAAALLFPVTVSAVQPLGLPILPFTIALIISVTCSFATPIGSPTHMLVYSPGGYRFTDFVKIGLPMNFVVLAVNVLSVYFMFF